MKFDHMVKYKGEYYPTGVEVPVGDSVNINTYDAEGNVAGSLSSEEVEELQKEASAAFEVQDKTKRGRKSKEE